MLVTLPLKKMSLEEKFMAMEAIWADIVHNSPDFPSPSWHEKILKERDAKIQTGEDQLIDWEDAKESLRKSLK